MKWGLIGYGSIGKRHAENLISLNEDVIVVTKNSDCLLSKAASVSELINVYKPEIVLISNETSLHEKVYKEIRTFSLDIPLLIEKPIFDMRYNFQNDLNTYVAYCLRFHPLVMSFKEILKNSKVIAANFYVGQYLPTWRAGRDYKATYSAKKELGGGALRDLSHELDLATNLLGSLKLDFCKNGKVSNLDITSDDYFSGHFSAESGANVLIEMNYLDRITQRYFTVHTNEMTIKVDFISAEITTNQSVNKLVFDKNQMYLNMLKSMKNKNYQEFASFEDGLKILDIISQAEKK